jgi:formate--tetrahydrofolate ligase
VQQIEAIATRLYGAASIDLESQARKDLERIEELGLGRAPVCMAKTHLSLSHDPALRNRPTGFVLPVRALVPSAGAGFVVALCGEMQRMPGLGKTPAFMNMDIDAEGRTVGLF